MLGNNQSVLKCVNLSKKYTGKQEVCAVNNVNLTFAQGEIVVIMGKSGAGKSTLLNLLGALDEPTEGEVWFREKSLIHMNEKERAEYRNKQIGFIYQNYSLLSYLKACENVMVPMFQYRCSRKKRINRAEELLSKMGLLDRMNCYPKELSGGEQQRIAIARALCNDPHIIIADEPTANVDSENEQIIMKEFVRMRDMGKLIIISTHNSEYCSIADKLLIMNNGIIVEDK